jgi:predicted nucleotidyltransferase
VTLAGKTRQVKAIEHESISPFAVSDLPCWYDRSDTNAGQGKAVGYVAERLTLEELRERREEILRIAAARGATNVRVFGSVARGEAGPESDVDFLVDLAPERTLFDLSGLILDLGDALGRKVDVVEISRPSTVANQIQREAIPL